MARQSSDTAIGNELLQHWAEFINSCMLLLRCLANKLSSECERNGSLEIRSWIFCQLGWKVVLWLLNPIQLQGNLLLQSLWVQTMGNSGSVQQSIWARKKLNAKQLSLGLALTLSIDLSILSDPMYDAWILCFARKKSAELCCGFFSSPPT